MYIAITFDDGYVEQYEYAKILKEMGVRATFYITTHAPSIKGYEQYELLNTNPDLIAEIAEMGHEIGSHTCTHPDLTILDRYRIEEELKESKKFLEDVTGREVLGFAYPRGRYSHVAKEVAKKYYLYARSTEIVGTVRELYNAPPRSLYELGAIPIFALRKGWLLKLLWQVHKHRNAKPIAYTHIQSITKLKLIVSIMKILGFSFVTVKELISKA
jgi:peptidoglycan/xylan/chitin deacetylase (PgdA/CDA1 family)